MEKKNYRVSSTGQDWHKPDCFGCGPKNASGLHADFLFDDETGEVRFSYIPEDRLAGPPGFLHGGITASLLDEAQGVLCFHVGYIVMTDQLNINYHHAVPLNQEVQIRCRITAVRKKRIYTHGEILSREGEVYASAGARWYVLSVPMLKRIFPGKYSAGELESIQELTEGNRIRSREIRRRLRAK